MFQGREGMTGQGLEEVAMQIILHAGDARTLVMESLKLLETENFAEAREKLRQASDELSLAHQSQTGIIQLEAQGIPQRSSLLFAHAQDTLMTIKSELNIAKQLIEIIAAVHLKIARLEERVNEKI